MLVNYVTGEPVSKPDCELKILTPETIYKKPPASISISVKEDGDAKDITASAGMYCDAVIDSFWVHITASNCVLNGEKTETEECDDGNNQTGDGCDRECKIETKLEFYLGPQCSAVLAGQSEKGPIYEANSGTEFSGTFGLVQVGTGKAVQKPNCMIDLQSRLAGPKRQPPPLPIAGILGTEDSTLNAFAYEPCNAIGGPQVIVEIRAKDCILDGQKLGHEECDDGNKENGDGCNDKCQIETKVVFNANLNQSNATPSSEENVFLGGYTSDPPSYFSGTFKLLDVKTGQPITKPDCHFRIIGVPGMSESTVPADIKVKIREWGRMVLIAIPSKGCTALGQSPEIELRVLSVESLTKEVDDNYHGKPSSALLQFQPEEIRGKVKNIESVRMKPTVEGSWGSTWCNVVKSRDSIIKSVTDQGSQVEALIGRNLWYEDSSSCEIYGPTPNKCELSYVGGYKIGSDSFQYENVNFEAWASLPVRETYEPSHYHQTCLRVGFKKADFKIDRYRDVNGKTKKWRASIKFRNPWWFTGWVKNNNYSQTREDTEKHERGHETQWVEQRFLTLDPAKYPWEPFSTRCIAHNAADTGTVLFAQAGMKATASRTGEDSIVYWIEPFKSVQAEDDIQEVLDAIYENSVKTEENSYMRIFDSKASPFSCAMEVDTRQNFQAGRHHPGNWACSHRDYGCPLALQPLPRRECNQWPHS